MVDQLNRREELNEAQMSAESMKQAGFTSQEIDQARKPEGLTHGQTIYRIEDDR